jgi:hypothetical protein
VLCCAVLCCAVLCRKTFQTLASLYFLLTKGVFGQPTCKKPLILCPTSLVQVRCAEGWVSAACMRMAEVTFPALCHADT